MLFTAENNLVIVPARSGSVRSPGKNVRVVGKHPLFAWSILTAKSVARLGRIFVSTDSSEYAAIAKEYGAEVPFLRSAETSTSAASTEDVLFETLERYAIDLNFEPKWLVVLQPTSPFRSIDTVNRGIDAFQNSGGETVVAVAPQKLPRSWMVDLGSDQTVLRSESSEKLPAYYICGAFYAVSVEHLMKNRQLYSANTRGVVVTGLHETLDIDTSEEMALAEALGSLDARR